MLTEVASKIKDEVGDGTTTAILLTQAIICEGIKNMAAGADPMGLRRGIHGAVDAAVQSIRESAYQLEKKEDIVQVASISGADPQTGEMLGDIMEQVGRDGVITVEESKTMDTRFEIVKGSQFDKGYLSGYMVTDSEKMIVEMDEPYLLFTDKKITDLQDILPILDQVAQRRGRLVIVAEGIVAGGGVAFCNAISSVQAYADAREGDERVGAQIVARALYAPFRQIVENAGMDGAVVATEAAKRGVGFGMDVTTGEYVDMIQAGIVDPAKVVRLALENAASMAAVFLTTEANVIDPKDEAWLRAQMAAGRSPFV